MEVILKNSEWNRARKYCTDVRLIDTQGTKCCLGILGLKLNIKKDQLMDIATPRDVFCSGKTNFAKLLINKNCSDNNNLAQRAMEINDDHLSSDNVKVYKLNRLFAKHDIQFIYREDL